MKSIINRLIIAVLCIGMLSCNSKTKKDMKTFEKGTFGYDVNYLSEKDSIIILTSDDKKAQVLVSPGYQAKVFTSTVDGLEGASLGYLNYKVLDSKEINEHMNGYGGENRLWLGPEGGKFSIYFKPGVKQVYDSWHTPAPFDTEAWTVTSASSKNVSMNKQMRITNYVGTTFNVDVNRSIKLISTQEIASLLGITITDAVKSVGYLTENKLTNTDSFEWTKDTGTICIWMLDMYNPAPNSMTIVPFKEGNEKDLGIIATTNYFGEIPADRLKVVDGVLYLKTDGKNRNKLGMSRLRTKSVAGNYDPDTKKLTITTFDVAPDKIYLNQEWNPEKDPLVGDAMNAYNDGPLEDGSIMGPFIEIESASPAAFLKPAESMVHLHNVFHFIGEEEDLTVITEKLFGVSIDKIKTIFK